MLTEKSRMKITGTSLRMKKMLPLDLTYANQKTLMFQRATLVCFRGLRGRCGCPHITKVCRSKDSEDWPCPSCSCSLTSRWSHLMPIHPWQLMWHEEADRRTQAQGKLVLSVLKTCWEMAGWQFGFFKGKDQGGLSQFNSQLTYNIISGTVYCENTLGSALLVSGYANTFWHLIKDPSNV